MQVCKKCEIEKPMDAYRTQVRSGKSYISKTCKACQPQSKGTAYKDWTPERRARYIQQQKDWQKRNPETRKRNQRRSSWKLQGINPDLAEAYYQSHHGKCDSCGQPNGNGRALCVDHDHGSGAIRGMLCDGCNMALGFLKDDPNRIQNVYDYIIARLPGIEPRLPHS